MFKLAKSSWRTSAITLTLLGLFVCTGSGPMAGDGGCDFDDMMDGADVLGGFDDSPVTPTGTGGPADPAAQSTAPQITVGGSATEVDSGTDVTFVVTITGGTGPYSIYWFLEGDNGWTLGGDSSTRKIEGNPEQTRLMYCVVYDANGLISNQFAAPVKIRAGSENCTRIDGRWRTIQGWVRLSDNGGNVTGSFGFVDGTFQDVQDGNISGTLSTGAPGCPDCVVLNGFWDDVVGNSGEIQYIFEVDLKHFDGKWSFTGNNHWQDSAWDGWRDACTPSGM